MSILETYPASFINLDVDLKSSINLSPITEYLNKSVDILSSDFFQGDFYLCMEPIFQENENFDVYHCTEYMLNVLEQLPPHCKELMNTCSSRIFDFGFNGGFQNQCFKMDLTPTQIARMSALNVSMRVTIYPYHPDGVLKMPKAIEE